MNNTSVKEIYKKRYNQFKEVSDNIYKQLRIISLSRLVVFLIGVFLIYYFARIDALAVSVTAVIFFSLFIFLVRLHINKIRKKKHIDHLLDINQREIMALNGDFVDFESGKEFLFPDHPFASDLDIFGVGSLFQFINRTATLSGRNLLASWLNLPLKDKTKIVQRQEGVKDLKDKLDWRQNFRAIGYEINEKPNDKEEIIEWSKEPEQFNHWIYNLILYIVPALNILLLVMFILGNITLGLFLLYLVLPFGIILMNLPKVNAQHNRLSRKSKIFNKYSDILKEIENEDFKSNLLIEMKASLKGTHTNSSGNIKKLSKILNALDSRLNMIAGVLLNYLLMWDLLQVKRLEKWKRKYKYHIEIWLDVIEQIDALASFANFYFNQPDNCLPEVIDRGNIINAKDAGHPIINENERVNNDILMDKAGQFLIITGANMAGKSTYLRTLGLNFVMAMAGMPVCASSYKFIPIDIFTSMRTRDSLYKNESYFYAELRRLKMIIDRLEEPESLLVILDEVLKGTNSKDKLTGSKALISQFIKLNAVGVIATHDLLLGEMIKIFPDNIKNYCFEVDIKDDQLYFDYKLRTGISQNLNATFLMKKMGITM